jgi:hypothetical protein
MPLTTVGIAIGTYTPDQIDVSVWTVAIEADYLRWCEEQRLEANSRRSAGRTGIGSASGPPPHPRGGSNHPATLRATTDVPHRALQRRITWLRRR